MAIKKKLNFGPFKVEEAKSEVVRLDNGMTINIVRNATNPDRIDSLKIKLGANECSISTPLLLQAAKVISMADDTAKFVCGNHGSYARYGTSRQEPECPACTVQTMDALRTKIGRGDEQLEDEDA